MPVEVQDVLRVAVAERVQDPRERRLAGVDSGREGGPMAERDDEVDRRIGLCSSEDRVGLRLPLCPRTAGVWLGIRDETDPTGVEPAPVGTAAPLPRRR